MRRITGCIILLLAIGNARGQVHDSLDIKIGQMILIGFPGTTADEKVIDEIAQGKVGSIIIFEKNIPPKNSFVELKKIIWTYQKAATIPLFITIDQEGGKVNRLKDKYGFPRSITAEAMGKSGSADSVRFYSEATASTLAGLGINVNFAPVVDVATNPTNPVIVRHGRSFSADQDSVVWMAKEVIAAHRRMGVLTVIKHFPGHGSSKNDTHLGIADVTDTWSELELKPYETLINEGLVNAVMTGHLVNKNLDSEGNPSTLSKPILEGVLRKKLGFNGVIFSEHMQMHAITKHYGLREAVQRAIDAGVDIMCFSNNIAGSDTRTVDAVHTIIKDLVATGAISRQRIDESYRRIMRLKKYTIEDPSAFYAGEIAGYKARISALEKEMVRMQEAAVTEPRKKKKRKKS